MRTAVVFFSATGVTGTIAAVICKTINESGDIAEPIDITPLHARKVPFPVHRYEAVIFGFPVYSDLAPSVVNEWLTGLDGHGKKCAMFFSYGARTTGYAHFHTFTLLEKAGFQVRLSAEFPGRHTYNVGGWEVLPDRPDETDFAVARRFAGVAMKGFRDNSPGSFSLQKPFGYDIVMDFKNRQTRNGERKWTHPFRGAGQCRMCRMCEKECPAGAFDADTGLSNPLTCIECMHCVYHCPQQVLKIDECMKTYYPRFLDNWRLNDEIIRAKKSRIIASPLDAAF